MKAKTFRIVCFSVVAFLLAVLIAVNVVFSIFEPIIAIQFSSTAMDSATRAAGETLATQIEEEGVVMVKNDDDCLPLKKADVTQVNVFGWAATQWVKGGSGSGRATNAGDVTSTATDFLTALGNYGISYNQQLIEKYKSFCDNRPFYNAGTSAGGSLAVHDYEYCRLIEPTFDSYSSDLLASAKSYSDVALVVLGRISGESIDCPKVQYKNFTNTGSAPTSDGSLAGAAVDNDRTYLDISTEEEALLQYVGENFEHVVVIVNSTNTMNLNFMDSIEGLDSCLIVGGSGNNAANALPGVIFGEKEVTVKDEGGEDVTKTVLVSPSGKTVDTYAYDLTTSSTYAYCAMDGVSQYEDAPYGTYPYMSGVYNGNVSESVKNEAYPGVSYLDYVEGIYVGYKWYETADTEGFWDEVSNEYGTGYEGVVQYPFGYGLTYTNFEWSVKGWNETKDTISVTVQVHNVGNYPAQEVVELYFNPPYTKNGIEKASVNLCAFAKTAVAVEPDETQELTLSFDIQDMASYDMNGTGGYVLEKGDYEISLRTDAHTVADIKTGSATYTYTVASDKTYNTYAGSNGTETIHNLFTGSGISDGIAIDGSDTDQDIQWLSRANFSGTFSYQKAAARKWNEKLAENSLFTEDDVKEWENEHSDASAVTTGANNGIKVYNGTAVSDKGLEYGNPENYDNDAMWDELLDQLTVSEMQSLVLHGYAHEEAIASIGKPRTVSVDGPSQIGSFNQVSGHGVGYPNPTVLAQSWNAELAKSYGLAVGKETLNTNRNGWYAPGANLHRSAFGGRNYEYYSEDSYLSGIMCAATVRGALNATYTNDEGTKMGVYTYIKHVIGYDQESMRDGLYCWMTEQALREIYLRPFKMAIDEGATGLMSSYGRLGSVWSGGSYALLTDLLREEWGFKGTVITDYSDHRDYMLGDQMIRMGGDLWMDYYDSTGYGNLNKTFKYTNYMNSNAFVQQLRTASKHIIYMCLNAAYEATEYVKYVNENGDNISVTRATSTGVFPWWTMCVVILDVVVVAGCGVWVFFAIRKEDKVAE